MNKYGIEFDQMMDYVRQLNYNTDLIDDLELKHIAIGIDESLSNQKILLAGKLLYCKKSYIRVFSRLLYREYVKWISKYIQM